MLALTTLRRWISLSKAAARFTAWRVATRAPLATVGRDEDTVVHRVPASSGYTATERLRVVSYERTAVSVVPHGSPRLASEPIETSHAVARQAQPIAEDSARPNVRTSEVPSSSTASFSTC